MAFSDIRKKLMSERLKAIENPSGFLMKLGYKIVKRRYGKVITPLKKIYARLPLGFALWSQKMPALERKLPISSELRLLIRTHVAQLNTCNFCIDISKAFAMKKFKDQEKFFQVSDFETSPFFSEKERLALRFATELTRNHHVSDKTYAACKRVFSDEELIGVAWVVTSEHVYNLMNVAFGIESDGLCRLPEKESVAVTA